MRIRTALWVVPVSELAGVARHVLDVARSGIPSWRLVHLLPEGPLAEELKDLGAAVLTGPVGPRAGALTAARAVRHTATRLRPQVVHSHLSYADVVTAAATAGLSCRLVTTEHGIADDDLVYHRTRARARLKAGMHTARLRRVDAAIAVSDATAEAMRRKWHPPGGMSITLLHNGIDAAQRGPRDPGLRVLSLARLAPEKGLLHLIRAFTTLHDRHPQARLTLAGAGPLEASLRREIDTLGLGDVVELPGHQDPLEMLRTHDVLAQLSVWENCSYSILDAVAHGLGVVATAVGGNPEILPERCLVDARDEAQVADALLRQGSETAGRPLLPEGWPTVSAMCAGIGEVYGTVSR